VHYLATEREHEAYRTLKQTIAFLKRRFDNLSNVFNGLNALTIVYDLFGRVLEVNQRMLELLKSQDLAPYKLTAADLVVKLTGNSLSHIQQLLRKVVNERRPLSFLVTLREKHYSLTIRPLAFNPVGDEFQEPAPFGIYGIVCELVETTSMLEVCELKEQMAEQFCDSLYHQLEDFLDLLASLEQSPGKEKQAKIIGICKYNIHNMIATINKWYAHKSRGSDLMDYSQILPVDPNRIIRMASDNLQSAAQEQQVVINITVPSPVSNVYAMPEFLRRTFERILTVIVKDTARKGKITVQAEEKDEWVKFDFSNKGNGFGTPGEKLKDQLFSQQDDPMMPLDMRKLRNALDWIKAWGGLLDVESDVGQGTRFTLHLARFN
jgi:signal transduction histidine kinase